MGNNSERTKVIRFMLDNRYYEHPEEIAFSGDRDIFYIIDTEDYNLLYASTLKDGAVTDFCKCDGTQKCYKSLFGYDKPCPGCSAYLEGKDATSSWVTTSKNKALHLIRSHYSSYGGNTCFKNLSTLITDSDEAFRHMQRIISSRELVMRCITTLTDESISPEKKFVEFLHGITSFYCARSAFIVFCNEYPAVYTYNRSENYSVIDVKPDDFSELDLSTMKRRMTPHSVCYLDDPESVKDSNPDIYAELIKYNIERMIIAPIFKGDNLLGFLAMNYVKMNRRDIPVLCTLTGIIANLQADITSHMVQEKISSTDSLTGLLNFEGFRTRALKLIKSDSSKKRALISVDIKDFKNINDFFGYDAGDDLLKYWGNYAKNSISEGSLVCRVQADTLCVLTDSYDDKTSEKKFISLTETLREYVYENISEAYSLDLCAGIYFIEENDPLSLNEMFNRSHMARGRAKQFPGSKLCIYDKELHEDYRFSKEIEMYFSEAVAKELIVPFFQPQMNLSDRAKGMHIIRAEALARWINEDGTIYARPDQFIPVFERTGQISKLDHFIYRSVCKVIREMKHKGIKLKVSINVSRYTMFKPGFAEYYEAIRQEYNISYDDIILEFTESISVSDMDKFSSIIAKLRKYGFVCSMDDFGSEYSSLNTLHLLDLNELKIDRAFFMVGVDTPKKEVIVNNILQLASNLNMESVAEGIETDEQIDKLSETDCDYIQGFAYAKPMSKNDFLNWIHKNS